MKFAICNEIFKNWSLLDTIQYVAKTGYDGLEIAPFTLADHVGQIGVGDRAKIREEAATAGIAIAGIHWVLVKTEGCHLTHPDQAVREHTSRYLCDLVDFCADVGGKVIVVGSPKQRNILPGVSLDQAWEYAKAVFADATRLAEDRGVVIALEPLSPFETNFINTAESAREFATQMDSRAFRIILDVKAMSSEAIPIPEIIAASKDAFVHFHANDKNLRGPGFGDVDFHPIGAALRAIGYLGYASVEVFDFSDSPEDIAEKSLAYLRECLS